MQKRMYHAQDIPFSLEQAWPFMDFPAPGWAVQGGGPREIGATRSMEIPQMGLIVDRLLSYSRSPNVCTFTYGLINEDNPFGAQGYEGTVTLMRNTNDPTRSFYTYSSRWDDAQQPLHEVLPGLLAGMMEQLIAQIGASVQESEA